MRGRVGGARAGMDGCVGVWGYGGGRGKETEEGRQGRCESRKEGDE